MRDGTPPIALPEFLDWLKLKTEGAWANIAETTLAQFEARGVGGSSWKPGTKWRPGLTADEIDAIEEKWSLEFPPDYRLFLEKLNAPDRWMSGASYRGGSVLIAADRPSFYDWACDDAAISEALAWPLDGLLFDVEQNDLWMQSWGDRPDLLPQRLAAVRSMVAAAPKLTPVVGHRYLVPANTEQGYAVLSVYQGDIITYGNDLRALLLSHLSSLINSELPQGQRMHDGGGISAEILAEIPFWGEFINQ
jgi:hypothetical protein